MDAWARGGGGAALCLAACPPNSRTPRRWRGVRADVAAPAFAVLPSRRFDTAVRTEPHFEAARGAPVPLSPLLPRRRPWLLPLLPLPLPLPPLPLPLPLPRRALARAVVVLLAVPRDVGVPWRGVRRDDVRDRSWRGKGLAPATLILRAVAPPSCARVEASARVDAAAPPAPAPAPAPAPFARRSPLPAPPALLPSRLFPWGRVGRVARVACVACVA